MQLYNYQVEDIKRLRKEKRFLNCNYMGLGKTVESIALVDEIGAKKILIVCRTALMTQWEKEIKKFSSNPLIKIIEGTKKKRESLLIESLEDDTRFIIINKEMLQVKTKKRLNSRMAEVKYKEFLYPILEKTMWDCVLIDEFHDFRGRGTQASIGISKLHTEYFVGLTGSPMYKLPTDIWNLLHLTFPRDFTSYWDFVEEHMQTRAGFFSKTEVVGVKNPKEFEMFLSKYMIRNLREDTDLPEKIEKDVYLKLSDEEQEEYDEVEKNLYVTMKDLEPNNPDYLKRLGTALEKMLCLQFVCLSQRIMQESYEIKNSGTKCEEILRILKESEGKVVVVSKYKKFIKVLHDFLKENDVKVLPYHGDLTGKQRDTNLNKFEKEDYKAILGTIGTIGTGLNLQYAQTLVFADKSFAPMENEQVISRIYRNGQTKKTFIINLIMADTIEEQINETVNSRTEAIDSALLLKNYINLKKEKIHGK